MVILIIIYIFTKDNTIYSEYNDLYLEDNKNQENNIDNLEETKNSIYVYVTGEVNKPTVVELKEGARIKDAIEKAGGITDSGEIKKLNLAYKLNDGEKLYIPSLDEVIESKENNTTIQYISSGLVNDNISNNTNNNENGENPITENDTNQVTSSGNGSNNSSSGNSGASNSSNNSSTSKSSSNNGLININTCTQTELESLAGIGPSTAKKIIDYRKENGKFKTIEDIKNVSGIGDAKYNGIKDSICVN